MSTTQKKYGLGRFLFDLFFGILTGGLWWLFLFLRFLFTNNK